MDIRKAKSLFEECGSDIVKEYESVVQFCRVNQIGAPLANGNFLHALTLTDLMFTHAEHSLRMLTGGAGDGFVACLKKNFCGMLSRLRRNGGEAQIIVVDGGVENVLLKSLCEEFPTTLQVKKGTASGRSIAHFIVADSKMVRDEQPHPPLTDSTDANIIKANVYFHSPAIAGLFASRFDAIWKQLSAS